MDSRSGGAHLKVATASEAPRPATRRRAARRGMQEPLPCRGPLGALRGDLRTAARWVRTMKALLRAVSAACHRVAQCVPEGAPDLPHASAGCSPLARTSCFVAMVAEGRHGMQLVADWTRAANTRPNRQRAAHKPPHTTTTPATCTTTCAFVHTTTTFFQAIGKRCLMTRQCLQNRRSKRAYWKRFQMFFPCYRLEIWSSFRT